MINVESFLYGSNIFRVEEKVVNFFRRFISLALFKKNNIFILVAKESLFFRTNSTRVIVQFKTYDELFAFCSGILGGSIKRYVLDGGGVIVAENVSFKSFDMQVDVSLLLIGKFLDELIHTHDTGTDL